MTPARNPYRSFLLWLSPRELALLQRRAKELDITFSAAVNEALRVKLEELGDFPTKVTVYAAPEEEVTRNYHIDLEIRQALKRLQVKFRFQQQAVARAAVIEWLER